jgi:hypothetical protein
MQRLAYNVSGQTMRHLAGSRQASVAWILEDLRYAYGDASRTVASGTANVDTATESTTAIAGPGAANPRSIEVASTSGYAISSQRTRWAYEIVNGDTGEREPIELAGIDTDDALVATRPLACTYPIGSIVQGLTHVTSAVPDAFLLDAERLANDWPARVVWIYADGTRHQEQVRLVHEPESDLFVTAIAADVYDLFPDLGTRNAHHERDVVSPWIRATIRQMRADALAVGLRTELWLAGEQGHWSAVYRTLLHAAGLGNVPASNDGGQAWREYLQRNADAYWNALTKGWGKAEVLEQAQATGIATSSDGASYRPIDYRDL